MRRESIGTLCRRAAAAAAAAAAGCARAGSL